MNKKQTSRNKTITEYCIVYLKSAKVDLMFRVFPIKNDDDDDNHNNNKEGKRKLWEAMVTFIALMVVLASWVYIYPQAH